MKQARGCAINISIILKMRSRGADFERFLNTPNSLKELDIDMFKLSAEKAFALASALEKTFALVSLKCRATTMQDAGFERLALALEKNTSVTELYIGYDEMGFKGAKALASMLEKNKSLTFLAIEQIHIIPEQFLIIAPALGRNTTLTRLALHFNHIRNQGAAIIASVLEKNTSSLKHLDIRHNWIDARGMAALAQALEHNTTLECLDLEDNTCLPQPTRLRIEALLERNRQGIEAVRSAIYYVLGIRRPHPLDPDGGMGVLGRLPKPVVHLIARAVWETRGQMAWVTLGHPTNW